MATRKKRILIAEDEHAMAKALELKLNHEGFDAVAVSNGEEALARAHKEQFDLILIDLVMPKVDGFEVLRQFQEQGNKVPVFVLSNLSQGEDAQKAKGLGAKEFYIKSDTSLLFIVERVCKELGG